MRIGINLQKIISGNNIPIGPQEYHLVYEFLEEHIQLTDPIKNEKLIPGENYYIYWDAYTNSTANFQLDYQLAGGSWVNIANNINIQIPANLSALVKTVAEIITNNVGGSMVAARANVGWYLLK